MISIDRMKQLRRETGISLAECKKALEEAGDDVEKAKEILRKKGAKLGQRKKDREVKEGIIASYVHSHGKIGVLLELRCESDFVARSEEFKDLAHELCLQIAALDPEDKDELLGQAWVKDESRPVKDLIGEHIARLRENIVVERFVRYEM